jgi:hypothetical protein
VPDDRPILDYRRRESAAKAWAAALSAFWFLLWVTLTLGAISLLIARLLRLWW